MRIAFLDNYDSFTYNLVHYFRELGVTLTVIEQRELPMSEEQRAAFDAVVVGPGPNAPEDAGNLLMELKMLMDASKPILGVCLGHQCLGLLLGMELKMAHAPMHGKVSKLFHLDEDIFSGMQNPMQIGRYHSLIVDSKAPESLKVRVFMRDELGQVMAFRHEILPFWGVQFHPESVLTPSGKLLLRNWIDSVEEVLS